MNKDISKIWARGKDDQSSMFNYSMEQIESLKERRTNQLYNSFRKLLWLSFSIVSLLLLGAFTFAIIASDLVNLRIPIIILITGCLFIMIYDMYLQKTVRELEVFSDDIAGRLKKLNDFILVRLPLYEVVNAFYNPILVILGMFYYQFYMYSEFTFKGIDDILVFCIIIVISYVVSFMGSRFGLSNIRKEAEELFGTSTEEDFLNFEITRRKRRSRVAIISLIILTLGIALIIALLTGYSGRV